MAAVLAVCRARACTNCFSGAVFAWLPLLGLCVLGGAWVCHCCVCLEDVEDSIRNASLTRTRQFPRSARGTKHSSTQQSHPRPLLSKPVHARLIDSQTWPAQKRREVSVLQQLIGKRRQHSRPELRQLRVPSQLAWVSEGEELRVAPLTVCWWPAEVETDEPH